MNLREQLAKFIPWLSKGEDAMPAPPKLWFAFESFATLFPFAAGAMLVVNYTLHRWGPFWLLAVVLVPLATTTVMRNVMIRWSNQLFHDLLKRQSELAKNVIDDNDRLLAVAISANRVRSQIACGMPPDTRSLTRDLEAVGPMLSLDAFGSGKPPMVN